MADLEELGSWQTLIGVRSQSGRLLAVAGAIASMPEVDDVVVGDLRRLDMDLPLRDC